MFKIKEKIVNQTLLQNSGFIFLKRALLRELIHYFLLDQSAVVAGDTIHR
jgi:hypothetical protein